MCKSEQANKLLVWLITSPFVIFGASVPVMSCFTTDTDQCDLTTSFLRCVDYVRETKSIPELEFSNAAGDEALSRKRPFQAQDDIPWGWAAAKVAELLQSYPSGLTSVILRFHSYTYTTLLCNLHVKET